MDNIKQSLSADHLPLTSPSPQESKTLRSTSAPARLQGPSIPFRITASKKGPINIPTPFELAEEEKAAEEVENYYHVRSASPNEEKPSLWCSLFKAQPKTDIRKSLQLLARHEDFHVDQAIKESKREFRIKIAAAGGNPDIAEAVFEATSGIPDLPSDDDPTWKSVSSFSSSIESDEDEEQSPFKTVPGESSKKANASLSLTTFESILNHLSREDIEQYLTSLPETEVRNLAIKNFEDEEITSSFNVSDLCEQLTDFYCSLSRTAQESIPLESPQAQQAIMAAFLEEPAPIQNQGLRNSGVDCYLSSALQCVRNHVSNLSPGRQEELLVSLRTRYLETLSPEQRDSPLAAFGSPLVAFLEKKFDGRNAFAAAFLRQEIHGIMERLSQSEINPSAAAIEMAESINPITGNSKQQCDTSEALVALMEHLETPRILLEERDTYHETGQARPSDNQEARQHGGELIVPFGVEQQSSLQEVIHSNWTAELTGANALEDADGSKHDVHRERALVHPPDSITISLARFRMKPDPEGGWAQNSRGEEIIGIPKLALDHLGRPIREKLHTPISHLTDHVTFPTRDHEGVKTETTYAPSSIICHYGGESANSGHYATFRKENETWFLVNDAQVTQTDLDAPIADGSNMTYRNFLEENAYIVNFRKLA